MSENATISRPSSRALDAPVIFQGDPSDISAKEDRFRKTLIIAAIFVSLFGLILIGITTYMFPVKAGNELTLVQRAPLAHGKTAKDATVLASQKDAETQALGRLAEMTRKDHRIVKILGIPGDKVTSLDNTLYVNGENTGVSGTVEKPAKLSISYLTKCVSGCDPNKPVLVPTKNIIGETR